MNTSTHRLPSLRDKRQVAQQFSRAAMHYNNAAAVQYQALTGLMERLAQSGNRSPVADISGHWLDIGCGTGNGFNPLLALGAAQITGIDLSPGMLQAAQCQSSTSVTLVQADADTLPLPDDTGDGIVSSLMLQWSEDTLTTLKEWVRVLKPGGTLAIATLLPGTHRELKQAWAAIDDFIHVNDFDSQESLMAAIQHVGLELTSLESCDIIETYQSVTDILKRLKAIGATNVNPGRRPGLMTRKTLQQLDVYYPKTLDNHRPLTYRVCWIIARKPNTQSTC